MNILNKKNKKLPVDKNELKEEIIKSLLQEELTERAKQIFYVLGKNIIRKKEKEYKSTEDRDDCLQEGYIALFSRWKGFDPSISDNAFAYYTEIFKRGMAKGYNDMYKKHKGNISTDNSNDGEGLFNF